MAELEIAPLDRHLDDADVERVFLFLREHRVARMPRREGGATTLGDRIDDDALAEFLELLDGHDASCDIYLPIPLTVCLEIGGRRLGSTAILLEALDLLRDELDVDEDSEDDDECDEAERRLRQLWRLFQEGAEAAQERRLALHVHR